MSTITKFIFPKAVRKTALQGCQVALFATLYPEAL